MCHPTSQKDQPDKPLLLPPPRGSSRRADHRTARSPDIRALADEASGYADQHPPGSLGRRAWACVAVALGTTRTLAAARRALVEGVRPPEVRRAALRALDAIADTPDPDVSGMRAGRAASARRRDRSRHAIAPLSGPERPDRARVG